MMLAWFRASEMTASSAQQRLEQAAVGVEAGRVEDRVLGAQEVADPLLELEVQVLVPQMNRTEAIPKPHRSSASCAAWTIRG